MVDFDVSAVMFDMDGVLVRSISGVEQCWIRWAERHRLTESFDIRQTHGRRAIDTIRTYFPIVTEAELAAHVEELDSFAEEERLEVSAYPGARELLRSLPPYRWTIVTSASERTMRSRLGAVGILMPASVAAGDMVARGKPDLEGYRRGAALLTREPHECLVIEDAPAGIRAGKAAGCSVLAIASSHAIEELGEADWVVASLDQIAFAITDSGALKAHFIQSR